ncbi:hypothetical protein, partial [Bradyrhizobium sp. JYMT SZCCT0428]|uniref:hypothetical protein n=1 Tax=Bradyrhizobium sp. JYMT SZCCT0428 TaxID=2807673 RepID=UPI001BA56EDC
AKHEAIDKTRSSDAYVKNGKSADADAIGFQQPPSPGLEVFAILLALLSCGIGAAMLTLCAQHEGVP